MFTCILTCVVGVRVGEGASFLRNVVMWTNNPLPRLTQTYPDPWEPDVF